MMEDKTKRLIGGVCAISLMAVSAFLFLMAVFMQWSGMLFVLSGLPAGFGGVLFLKYILDFPFPWEFRVRYPGGGD